MVGWRRSRLLLAAAAAVLLGAADLTVALGTPGITVAPTLQDWLTGRDSVLAAALSYGRPG